MQEMQEEQTEYTVQEAMLESEPCEAGAGPKNPGAVAVLIL